MKRKFTELTFVELAAIAASVSVATGKNVLTTGADATCEKYGLLSVYEARAVNLILCAPDSLEVMNKLVTHMGDKASTLTLGSPDVLCDIFSCPDVELDYLGRFLSNVANRVRSLEEQYRD